MNVLYDIELSNGDKLECVYFNEYHKPIRSGKGAVLMWVSDHLKCFDEYDKEITGKDFTHSIITAIYDQETREDITDTYSIILENKAKLNSRDGMFGRIPFAREVVRLN